MPKLSHKQSRRHSIIKVGVTQSAEHYFVDALDADHGSLFQHHESFVKEASLFLDSEKQYAERKDRIRGSSSDDLLPARSNESRTWTEEYLIQSEAADQSRFPHQTGIPQNSVSAAFLSSIFSRN
jgi:hypothetical protein